jgi:hypothetical protein
MRKFSLANGKRAKKNKITILSSFILKIHCQSSTRGFDLSQTT